MSKSKMSSELLAKLYGGKPENHNRLVALRNQGKDSIAVGQEASKQTRMPVDTVLPVTVTTATKRKFKFGTNIDLSAQVDDTGVLPHENVALAMMGAESVSVDPRKVRVQDGGEARSTQKFAGIAGAQTYCSDVFAPITDDNGKPIMPEGEEFVETTAPADAVENDDDDDDDDN